MKNIFLIAALSLFGTNALFAQTLDDLLGKSRGLLVCGHRGGFYKDLPENSLAAIDHTVTGSAPSPVIVEFDVRKSKDGTLFVMHDAALDRTTSGHGRISESPDLYLNSLFLKKGNGELSDQKIPTFETLLQYAATNNVLLMLDSKGDVWPEAIGKLAEKKLDRKTIVLTFTAEDSRAVSKISREVRISCLIKNADDWEAIRAIPRQQVIAYIDKKTDLKLIEQIRTAKIPVMTDVSENTTDRTYPFGREFYAELVKNLQLDILITDYPVDVVKIFHPSNR
jgi:glycerophosphoryl diester phosphodiesterase